jgi:hypothetical protein
LHRLLPPSAIGGVSLVIAVGPWLFTEPVVLRVLAAGAAVTAVVGAVVLRRWDTAAGKRVADLTRARASDEWRFEERVAELETDLDESRELRVKLEHKLRAKRAELAGLRNEHAALLRRYATAETERASVLETRRLLAIEASAPARALPAGLEQVPASAATRTVAVPAPREKAAAVPVAEPEAVEPESELEAGEAADVTAEEPSAREVFSPSGSSLFLRANAALNRFANGTAAADAEADIDAASGADAPAGSDAGPSEDAVAEEGEAQGKPEAVDGHEHAAAVDAAPADAAPEESAYGESALEESAHEDSGREGSGREDAPAAEPDSTPAAVKPSKPSQPVQSVKPTGHFTVPTAVAVVPATPARRPSVEGGFDFFGTQKEASAQALEAVQNEDLADVVGQEALALHKAEAEAGFKPVSEESRGVGQVIDLTVHDETEQINVSQLRSAVS